MSDNKGGFFRTLKIVFLIIITFGLILVLWYIKKRMELQRQKEEEQSHNHKQSKYASRMRIAFGLIVVFGLMFIIGKMELGQYFMTSMLNIQQKMAVQHEAQIREGLPYEYGSTGPDSFDCSGFTLTVVKEALGVDLPRTSRDQYTVGRDIAFEQIAEGDLVFFDTTESGNISHVGIITEVQGDAKFMTHANSYYGKVMKEKLEGYWLTNYYGARELTNVTSNMVASSDPDETYDPPVIEDDQYDGDFPPSEPTGDNIDTDNGDTDNGDSTDDSTTTDEQVFPDVPSSHPNYKAITYLKKNNIIGGYSDGTFKPSNTVTRAETLKIALNGAGINSNAYAGNPSVFPDVDESHTLKQYMNYAKANGIVNGYPDGTYKPNNTITKGESAKVMINIKGINPPIPAEDPYYDVPKTLDLAKFIAYVRDKKLLDISGANFGINNNMSRGDVAEMMYRLIVLEKTGASQYTNLLSI